MHSMSLYKKLLRPILFSVPPEAAHTFAVEACRIACNIPILPKLMKWGYAYDSQVLETQVAGIKFANPIGLAAGWDKSARSLRMLDHLGFGFAEIGSVSARPSTGNPKPRLFRLQPDRAIVVNYGLPNEGAEVVAKRLAIHSPNSPLGVNIVKTNDGPDALECSADDIFADYEKSVSLTHRYASYLTLNLSCPNAKGGNDFFVNRGAISELLERLRTIRIGCPVFLKVAPNPEPGFLEQLLEEVDAFSFVRGFSFNLPSGKPSSLTLQTDRNLLESMPGAVAGKPVEQLINQCISELYHRMPKDRYEIMGAGGVFSAEDAYLKIRLGASLVQIYTALIYEGPGVVKKINRGLDELLRRDGITSVRDAVGSFSR